MRDTTVGHLSRGRSPAGSTTRRATFREGVRLTTWHLTILKSTRSGVAGYRLVKSTPAHVSRRGCNCCRRWAFSVVTPGRATTPAAAFLPRPFIPPGTRKPHHGDPGGAYSSYIDGYRENWHEMPQKRPPRRFMPETDNYTPACACCTDYDKHYIKTY